MKSLGGVAVLSALLLLVQAQEAPVLNQLSTELRENLLDPEACYEVRDFAFRRNEARLFLSDGYLIFRKPVGGRRLGALFVAREETGDAEILLIPPNRLERQSLLTFTGAPTLNEHFRLAAFLFTDGTGERWIEELNRDGLAKLRPERGQLLAEAWNPTMRNLGLSLETRLIEDLANRTQAAEGIFFAAISATKLGNFDLLFDPKGREELLVGQLVNEDGRSHYDFWTHFEPKRATPRAAPEPPAIVKAYRVEARIDSELNFQATVEMDLEARRPLAVLPVDLSPRLRLSKAAFNGQPAELYRRESLRANLWRMGDVETSLLRFPTPLAAGQRGTAKFDEDGKILFRSGNGVLYLATRAVWFPQVGWQAAPFRARFRHPKNLTLVCPGVRQESVEGEERVTLCQVDQPIRLFGFNLGEFERREATREGIHLEIFANKKVEPNLERPPVMVMAPPAPPPGVRRRLEIPPLLTAPALPASPLDRLPAMTQEISGALAFFQGILGPPPLPRVVAAPIPGNFGQGFPGFLYLSTLAYLENRNLPAEYRAEWQNRHFRELLEAHEVAHQWWGNLVTFDSYRDEWLSEALANYSALLYLEKLKGAKAVEAVLEEYRKRLLREGPDGQPLESAGPVVFGMRIRSTNPQAWQAVTYDKASWILHMLRGRLGDGPFVAMLGRLAKDFAARPMTSEDLRRAAAAGVPKGSPDPQLEDFFDAWVYGTGVPQLELSHVVKGVGPKTAVEVTVKQTRAGEGFAVDVPVEILLPRGRRIVRWVRTGAEPETIRVATGVAPLKVHFDPKAPLLRQIP